MQNATLPGVHLQPDALTLRKGTKDRGWQYQRLDSRPSTQRFGIGQTDIYVRLGRDVIMVSDGKAGDAL